MEFYHHMSYRTRDLTILRCFICIKKINKITLQNIYSVAGFAKGLFFCVCVCVCVCVRAFPNNVNTKGEKSHHEFYLQLTFYSQRIS